MKKENLSKKDCITYWLKRICTREKYAVAIVCIYVYFLNLTPLIHT